MKYFHDLLFQAMLEGPTWLDKITVKYLKMSSIFWYCSLKTYRTNMKIVLFHLIWVNTIVTVDFDLASLSSHSKLSIWIVFFIGLVTKTLLCCLEVIVTMEPWRR